MNTKEATCLDPENEGGPAVRLVLGNAVVAINPRAAIPRPLATAR